MVRVVGIHGIAQEYQGPNTLKAEWVSALQDGTTISGVDPLDLDDLGIVFYGDLFRPAGSMAAGIPAFTAADVADGFEKDLLQVRTGLDPGASKILAP